MAHIRDAHIQIAKHIKNRNYFQFTPRRSENFSYYFFFYVMLFSVCFFFSFVVVVRGVVFSVGAVHYFIFYINFYVTFFFFSGKTLLPSFHIKNNIFFSLIYSHKYFVSVLMLAAILL